MPPITASLNSQAVYKVIRFPEPSLRLAQVDEVPEPIPMHKAGAGLFDS